MDEYEVAYSDKFDLAEFLLLPENQPTDAEDAFYAIHFHIRNFDWSHNDRAYKRNVLRDFIAAGFAPSLKAIRRRQLRTSYATIAWMVVSTARGILDNHSVGQTWSED